MGASDVNDLRIIMIRHSAAKLAAARGESNSIVVQNCLRDVVNLIEEVKQLREQVTAKDATKEKPKNVKV